MEKVREVRKTSLTEVLSLNAGEEYTYDYCMGGKVDKWEVTIILKNGRKVDLPIYHECHEYGSNHDPNWERGERKCIGEVLNEFNIKPEDIKEVIVYNYYYCSWEDYGEEDKEIIYIVEDTFNIEDIRREIIEKIKDMNEQDILNLYYKFFY